jgi:hypothetical protein
VASLKSIDAKMICLGEQEMLQHFLMDSFSALSEGLFRVLLQGMTYVFQHQSTVRSGAYENI